MENGAASKLGFVNYDDKEVQRGGNMAGVERAVVDEKRKLRELLGGFRESEGGVDMEVEDDEGKR